MGKRARGDGTPKCQLPTIGKPANSETDAFMKFPQITKNIKALFKKYTTVFLRAGVAVGKTTMGRELHKLDRDFVFIGYSGNDDDYWTWAIALAGQTIDSTIRPDSKTVVGEVLRAAEAQNKILVFDEAHTLFGTTMWDAVISKNNNRPKMLLLSASSQATEASGELVVTPNEVDGKFMWYPVAAPAPEFADQLQQAGVLLTQPAVEFLWHFSANIRGVFLVVLRWVRQQQEEERKQKRQRKHLEQQQEPQQQLKEEEAKEQDKEQQGQQKQEGQQHEEEPQQQLKAEEDMQAKGGEEEEKKEAKEQDKGQQGQQKQEGQKEEAEDEEGEEWGFHKVIAAVRRSVRGQRWSEGGVLKELAKSRAVNVNGKFSENLSIPREFIDVLAEGPVSNMDARIKKNLTIAGFLLPVPNKATAEFIEYDWNSEDVPFGVANYLMARYYRHRFETELHLRVRMDDVQLTCCTDLLLKALPYMGFQEVVAPVLETNGRELRSACVNDDPFEQHFTGTMVHVLRKLGYDVSNSENAQDGKVDIYGTIDKVTYGLEGIRAACTQEEHREHRARFDDPNKPYYSGVVRKCLFTMGTDVQQVRDRMKGVKSEEVEIVGIVLTPALTFYTVYTILADVLLGPYYVRCDHVARSLRQNEEGVWNMVCCQKLESIDQRPAAVSTTAASSSGSALPMKKKITITRGEDTKTLSFWSATPSADIKTGICDTFGLPPPPATDVALYDQDGDRVCITADMPADTEYFWR